MGKATLETIDEFGTTTIDDEGALDYGSVLAGFSFNMGKVVSFNARYTMALDESYVIMGKPGKTSMVQVGLSFRLFTSRRSAFVK